MSTQAPQQPAPATYAEHEERLRSDPYAAQLVTAFAKADKRLHEIIYAAAEHGIPTRAARAAATTAALGVIAALLVKAKRVLRAAVREHYIDAGEEAAALLRDMGRRRRPRATVLDDDTLTELVAGAQRNMELMAARVAVTSTRMLSTISSRQRVNVSIAREAADLTHALRAAADAAGVTYDGELKTKQGQFRLINTGSRAMRADAWARMVANTALNDARSQGVLDACAAYGWDLVAWSKHADGDRDRACAEHEGHVYSISGASKHFPRLTLIPPAHPNCYHHIYPIAA